MSAIENSRFCFHVSKQKERVNSLNSRMEDEWKRDWIHVYKLQLQFIPFLSLRESRLDEENMKATLTLQTKSIPK